MSRFYLHHHGSEQYFTDADYAREFLFVALNIGEEMLVSGAEVSRVEDSVRRICTAYGAERVDVFAVATAIFVSVYSHEYGTVTQIRRITAPRYDLFRLSRLNSLSRRICAEKTSFEEVENELEDIKINTPVYPAERIFFMYALISFSFTLFFGGSLQDAMASAVIGLFLRCMDYVSRALQLPPYIAAVLWSFAGGCLAQYFVSKNFGDSADLISVGNVMLLIPGMLLTNSIRDIFSGDTLSAIMNFCNAFLLASLIAFGFALPTFLWGV